MMVTADDFIAVVCREGEGVGSLSFRLSPCPASALFLSKEGLKLLEVLKD